MTRKAWDIIFECYRSAQGKVYSLNLALVKFEQLGRNSRIWPKLKFDLKAYISISVVDSVALPSAFITRFEKHYFSVQIKDVLSSCHLVQKVKISQNKL